MILGKFWTEEKTEKLGDVMLLSCCFREPKLKKEVESCCSDEEYSQKNPAKEVKP